MKNKIIIIFVFVLVFGTVFLSSLNKNTENFGSLDKFASCLTEKGAKMYGTKWCPYCQKEKESFGESFRLINYTECTENPTECTNIGVNKLPTWIMRDGEKLEGLQGLEKLSFKSSCPLQ